MDPFFEISQQIHTMYEKVAIVQIWHRTRSYFIGMNNKWYMITVRNMNKICTFFQISQHSNFIKNNCHNYSNLAQNRILFYMHQQQPMVPDHGTQYEENPSSHHGRMQEDEHVEKDWTHSYFPLLCLSGAGNNNSCFNYTGSCD